MTQKKNLTTVVDVDNHGLKKYNVKVSTVVFMIFCVGAAGAYGIEEMISETGAGLTLVMLMVLPLVWSTPLGLVASELGSARPQEGGYYKWVQEALGEYWGFQAGWWRTISIYIDNTLYVILAGGYLASILNLTESQEMGFKITMILFFTWINLRGIRDVGRVSSILATLVIIAFVMVTVCGFMNWNHNPFIPFTAAEGISGVSGLSFSQWIHYIGMGIALGMWMYSGYESISTIAGEIDNPQVIPKATIITVPLIVCVCILPTMAGLASIGQWQNWGTEPGNIGYADVIMHYWSQGFGIFFVIVAILSQCSSYNTYIASGSRGFFVLSDDYLAPAALVKCDKKRGVPYVSVLSVTVVNLILCQFDFKTVVVIDVFLLIASYIMIFISAMILRKKIPEDEFKFKIPGGYGFLCILCIVPCIVTFLAFFINGADYFIGGMLGIITGPIMYVIWKKMYGGLTNKNPRKYPINYKTGLAVGDLKRIAFTLMALAVMGFIAVPWLNWFEGTSGPLEYLETYGTGFFSDFDLMLNTIKVVACVFSVIAAVLFLVSTRIEPKGKL